MEKPEKSSSSSSEIMASRSADETSPDLLKNTPSNIARLEDQIEQCKGRQKYLARTKSPSDGEDVRWYFCKVPLPERLPQTEIVGRSDYFRFSMRESLALEASFLQREEELLSYWWKEYAECSEGPSGPRKTLSISGGYVADELYFVEEERVGVPVKRGLYEVDLTKRHCFPVYWHGENRRVLRGHWFAQKGGLDWLPPREDVAEQLEPAYRCQDELRQQKEAEMDDYCSQVSVGHLVFMVHGIGQRLDKANLVDDVGDFRRITSSLAERHLSPYQRCTQRVLFIPCQNTMKDFQRQNGLLREPG